MPARRIEQTLGRIAAAIEYRIFYGIAQILRQVRIDRELARIDYTHVHARANRVVQEHRVDRLTHDVIAAE